MREVFHCLPGACREFDFLTDKIIELERAEIRGMYCVAANSAATNNEIKKSCLPIQAKHGADYNIVLDSVLFKRGPMKSTSNRIDHPLKESDPEIYCGNRKRGTSARPPAWN